MDFKEIISNFSNGISAVEMDLGEEVSIRTEMIRSGFDRELVTVGDVNFISDLFKGKLILNENIFYRPVIKNYGEYTKWKEDKKPELDKEKLDYNGTVSSRSQVSFLDMRQ